MAIAKLWDMDAQDVVHGTHSQCANDAVRVDVLWPEPAFRQDGMAIFVATAGETAQEMRDAMMAQNDGRLIVVVSPRPHRMLETLRDTLARAVKDLDAVVAADAAARRPA